MSKLMETIMALEGLIEDTAAWCDSKAERDEAALGIKNLMIELGMEVEIAGNGDYSSRLSQLESSVNKMFECDDLSSDRACFHREGALTDLHVLKRADRSMD